MRAVCTYPVEHPVFVDAIEMARKEQKPLLAKIAPDHPMAGIVENAYRVFRYAKPGETGVCRSCCMAPEIEADFFTPDIRELPLHYLNDWYNGAYDGAGVPKAVWGYLLPRVLEVLACGQEVTNVGREVSLNRYRTGHQDAWSKREWDVLEQFRRAYLERDCKDMSGEFLDDTLCMFALAGWPLEDLFRQIADMPDEVLAERFWKDWCKWSQSGYGEVWITAFWPKERMDEVLAFYTSHELRERMEALTLSDDTDGDLARKASDVLRVMEQDAAKLALS